uniref:Magnesium-dependent phosphatase-1 n=2 Tax=Aureoumbra lagunensis TaxID=44058 RepID=A0A7S3K0S9_9STRA
MIPKLFVFDLDATIWMPELYTLRRAPKIGKEIHIIPEALTVLQECEREGFKVAVASRTNKGAWARQLLKQVKISETTTLESLCGDPDMIQIFPADKQEHLKNLQQATNIPYSECIFFDDALSGRYGNCERVAKLGCLSIHTPDGLTIERWRTGLDAFANGKRGIVIQVQIPQITLPCISMAMPFAALLLNGEKSLESRNAPIFKDIAKQQCLIRVGHKDWEYDQQLFDKLNIPKKALELPRGIRRGDIAGICHVGETMPKTQLSDDDIERQVLVSFQASGKFVTHISNPKWFSKGHKSPGKPGIYFAQVPTHLLSPHVSSRSRGDNDEDISTISSTATATTSQPITITNEKKGTTI